MNRPSSEQFAALHLYPHQLDEQLLRTENNLSHRYFSSSTTDKAINRHLSMPSYDQFHEEEQPLRIHVGNIPFLWTIDDLRKQFLVFGPVKDPEIVSNERGSKGFGFITFLRASDGMNAIRVKNGSIADGRKITVALASSRSSSRLPSQHHCCCCGGGGGGGL